MGSSRLVQFLGLQLAWTTTDQTSTIKNQRKKKFFKPKQTNSFADRYQSVIVIKLAWAKVIQLSDAYCLL
jgi:Holliday junction resolvase RusA-like endonuclease